MITPSFSPTATERVLPKLALDFTTASLDARVTLTRALNTATCVNSSGNVAVVNANLPRFDYDPTTLVCKGLLIEESRVNSLTNNTATGAAAGSPGTAPTNWFPTTTTGVFTRTIVGTGTENGIAYIDIRYQASGAGNASVQFEGGTTIAASNGQTWTFSSYTKLVGGSLTNVTINDSLIEDTIAGVFVTGGDSSTYVPTSASLITQRRTFTRTNTGGVTTAYIYPRTKIAFSGAGDVTLRFGLPQLELGAFATSVIQTSSGAVTRNADVATMTGTNFSSWYNASEGAFETVSVLPYTIPSGQFPCLFQIAGTAGNTQSIYQFLSAGANRFSYDGTASGAGQWSAGSGSSTFNVAANVTAKYCGAYKANSIAGAVNGVSPVTDSSATIPTVTTATIGSVGGTSQFWNGYVQKIYYWPQRLINNEVQAFSK